MHPNIANIPQLRSSAWRELIFEDHGYIRSIFKNSHPVSAQMWRTSQPGPNDIANWARLGIKTVINLRNNGEKENLPGYTRLEKEACRDQGIKLENFQAFSRKAPSKEFILDFNSLVKEIQYPAIMHCKSGADRVGLSSVLYLFLKERTPLSEAREHLSIAFGHLNIGPTAILDQFFDSYVDFAKETNTDTNAEHFLNWVINVYDPITLQRQFRSPKFATFLIDKILHRE